MLSIICVIGKNREIGYQNKLLWGIPEDMKHFKEITTGHPVIMGSKTFESIGRALPGRLNIVLHSNPDYPAPDCTICGSLEEAIKLGESKSDEVFIIGGGSVYAQAIPLADKLYLTMVEDAPPADTYFPDYSEFEIINSGNPIEYNNLKFRFVEMKKRAPEERASEVINS